MYDDIDAQGDANRERAKREVFTKIASKQGSIYVRADKVAAIVPGELGIVNIIMQGGPAITIPANPGEVIHSLIQALTP